MCTENSVGQVLQCRVEGESLHVRGEVDLNTAPALYQALVAYARDNRALPTIDLSGVTYLDSSGIHALISARRHVEDSPAARIVGARRNVARVMRLVGLDKLYDIAVEDDPTP